MENADAKTDYRYDSLGRLIQEKNTIKAAGNREVAVGYGYNSESQLTTMTYPDQQALSYGYDELKRLNAIRYGSANQALINYTYNENGTIGQIRYGNGTTVTYTYDRNILLKSIRVTTSQNAVIYSQESSYDTPGKMTETRHTNYLTSVLDKLSTKLG